METVTYEIALEQFGALKGLGSIALDEKAAWGVARNLARFKRVLKPIEEEITEGHQAAIDLYAEKDGDGKPRVVNGNYDFGDNYKSYQKRVKELESTEVQIDYFKIKQSDFPKTELKGILLAPLLDYIITED